MYSAWDLKDISSVRMKGKPKRARKDREST
jgi:hypothetical protein